MNINNNETPNNHLEKTEDSNEELYIHSTLMTHSNGQGYDKSLVHKVSKGAKIRDRYNQ